MGKYLNDVMRRAKEIRSAVDQGLASDKHQQNMATVEALLAQEKCFLKMEPQVSGSLLLFLGYPEEELFFTLSQLVFEQSTEGKYTYIDPEWVENHSAEDPEDEPEDEPEDKPEDEPQPDNNPPEENEPEKEIRYYQCKTDEIFRVVGGRRFELLKDGNWEYCPSLRGYFFDAASDYWEIREPVMPTKKEQPKCPNCGTEVMTDHLFCMACGTDLRKRYCRCGRALPDGAAFCPYCGKKQ